MQIPDIYFSDLFDNASDLIQYVREEGAIENVNPAWLLTLGYRFDEVKGRSIYDFVAVDERSDYRAYRETTIVKQLNDDIPGKKWDTGYFTGSLKGFLSGRDSAAHTWSLQRCYC